MLKISDVVASLVFALTASVTAEAAIINVVLLERDLFADANTSTSGFDEVTDMTLPPVSLSVSDSEGGNSASASQTVNAYSLDSNNLAWDIAALSELSVIAGSGSVIANGFTLSFELTAPLAYEYSATLSATDSVGAFVYFYLPTDFFPIDESGTISSSGILDVGTYDLLATTGSLDGGVGDISASYSVSLTLGPISIPEPSSCFALVAGACALTCNRRRKGKSY